MESRDLFSVVNLGLEGFRSRFGLEGFRFRDFEYCKVIVYKNLDYSNIFSLLYLQVRNNQNTSKKCQNFEKNSSEKHGRPQKLFQGRGKLDVLLIVSMLLMMQCKSTLRKCFALSIP